MTGRGVRSLASGRFCSQAPRARKGVRRRRRLFTLRLGGMETTISRLRQSLKLEDAARQLMAH